MSGDSSTDGAAARDGGTSNSDTRNGGTRLARARAEYDDAVRAEREAWIAATPELRARDRRRRAALRLFGAAALVLVVVLLAAAAWTASLRADDRRRLTDDEAARAAAAAAITRMLTADPVHADAYVRGVLEVSTGAQRERTTRAHTELRAAVAGFGAPTTGQVLTAGVQPSDGGTTPVLVVAQASAPELVGGVPGAARITVRVLMIRSGERWLVHDTERILMSGAAPSRPRRSWRELPEDRRFVRRWVVTIVLAAVVALGAGIVLIRAAAGVADHGSTGERAAVARAAATAVTDLMTYAPDRDADDRRRAVAAELTGPLAADYLGRGPDTVFPGAVASRITMTAEVLDAGVAELSDSRARVLIFVDQTVTVEGGLPERLAHSRWATMLRFDGAWRLARLEPVAAR
ncbi:MAG: hypothetical protein QM809_07610 [Gordonia sp. (in: high G+C Gram-positive bacteria)]|uniref:hypothetical protein n=1 Tax=Gordonia sp. (in: high G+C Gram-positive bacteria) TaxID=84139 RepID=UPI0039E39263